MDMLDKGLATAGDWTVGWFGNDVPLWQGCVGAVVFTCELGRISFKAFDEIPYLYARLRQPGIRDRCRQQFESVPWGRHDRLTQRLNSGALLEDLNAMAPDGTGISAALDREAESMDKPNALKHVFEIKSDTVNTPKTKAEQSATQARSSKHNHCFHVSWWRWRKFPWATPLPRVLTRS